MKTTNALPLAALIALVASPSFAQTELPYDWSFTANAGLFTDYIKTEVQVWMFAILAIVTCVQLRQQETSRTSETARHAEPPQVQSRAQP